MRDIQIFGELMVTVKGEPGSGIGSLQQLGVTVGGNRPVRIRKHFKHKDKMTDDYGPEVPAELLTRLAEVTVEMTLSHYDEPILNVCEAESLGGGVAGILAPAGTPMGGGVPVLSPGNHYITLNLVNIGSPGGLDPAANLPWRFFTSVLTGTPVVWPVGTGHSEVDLTWRVIPYAFPSLTQQRQLISVTTTDQLNNYLQMGFITVDQFNAYAALIQSQGFAMVPAGNLVTTPGEILSSGAMLWDRNLQN